MKARKIIPSFKYETLYSESRNVPGHRQLYGSPPTIGAGLCREHYKDALQVEFRLRGIAYEREKRFGVLYKQQLLPHYYLADFVVFDQIILELKAVSMLADIHIAQTLNYMKVSGCRIGLLINFNSESLQYHRFVL